MESFLTIAEVVPTYRRPVTGLYAIRRPEQVANVTRQILDVDNNREHFIVYHLDGNHQIINYNIAGIGTANSCPIHPRDVFQAALLNGSVSIIVAHNHPSGNISASREDINITHDIVKAGELLKIKVLDHVIVTNDSYHSMRENNDCKF
jgi:DNA repair protein RadC